MVLEIVSGMKAWTAFLLLAQGLATGVAQERTNKCMNRCESAKALS